VQPLPQDFAPYITARIDKCYVAKGGVRLFPVPVQIAIFQEFAKDHNMGAILRNTKVDITPFYHHVTVSATLRSLETGRIHMQAMGSSTRYSWEYTGMARNAATESADTIATGKALGKMGITPDGALRSQEEEQAWEAIQTITNSDHIEAAAIAFSKLSREVKYEAQKQGLDIVDALGIIDVKAEDAHLLLEKAILEGTIFRQKESRGG
jgi:hypothetical protein